MTEKEAIQAEEVSKYFISRFKYSNYFVCSSQFNFCSKITEFHIIHSPDIVEKCCVSQRIEFTIYNHQNKAFEMFGYLWEHGTITFGMYEFSEEPASQRNDDFEDDIQDSPSDCRRTKM